MAFPPGLPEVLGFREFDRWMLLNDPAYRGITHQCSEVRMSEADRLRMLLASQAARAANYREQFIALTERTGISVHRVEKPAAEAKASRTVHIELGELARLQEAAAYAAFARPILEKLGDKNPLADI
jgi:hypothetical protein